MAIDINLLPNTYKNLLTDKNRSGNMNKDADNTSPGENINKILGGLSYYSQLSYLFSISSVGNLSFVTAADTGGVDQIVHVVTLLRYTLYITE